MPLLPALHRFIGVASALAVTSAGALVGAAAPAEASSLLCIGYTGCAALGMSSSGYSSANATMYWRMFSGHNCTNYAAYRMVRSGLPNVRPWTGSGNASNWGHAMSSLTNAVPRVGAVAWYDAYVSPAGSAGHVAYVEKVVSADEIIVSQDSWGGTFSWARLTRTSGGHWPSGFVHFNDVPLKNTVLPAVTGTAKVGSVLTATSGTWSQIGATFAYQWLADGVAIPQATATTLPLALAQEGKQITVRVTASKLGYPTTSAISLAPALVQPGVLTSSAPPTVVGTPEVGATLTASGGTWSPAPTRVRYQWTSDGQPITGATDATLAPGALLVGHALAVTVTATRSGYADVSARSTPTAPVARGTIARTVPATIGYPVSVTEVPRPGQTLRVDPGTVTPSDATFAVQWLRSGVAVPGRVGPSYTLAAADLGTRISARVTVSKAGYGTVATRTATSRLVKAVPAMKLTLTPGTGRLGVTAALIAAPAGTVTGVVRIRSAGVLLAEVTLRQGSATTTLLNRPAGPHTYRIRYLGSDTVTATTLYRTVTTG